MLSEAETKRKNQGTESSIKEESKDNKIIILHPFDSTNYRNRESTVANKNIKENTRYTTQFSSLNPKQSIPNCPPSKSPVSHT